MVFGYIDVFCREFDTNAEEALIVFWISTAERIAAEVKVVDGRSYMIVTPEMIKEELHIRGARKRIGGMLSELVEKGALERVKYKGMTYAYSVTKKALYAMHMKSEKVILPKWIDGNSHWSKMDQSDKIPLGQNGPMKPIIYNIYNGNKIPLGQNGPMKQKEFSTKKTTPPLIEEKKEDDIKRAFDRFWSIYPKHKNKAEAYKRFKKLKLHKEIDDLLKAVKNYCNDKSVKNNLIEGNIEFVKNPDTFLITRGVEYWRDYVEGTAKINTRLLFEEDTGGKDLPDRIERFASKVRMAIAEMESLGQTSPEVDLRQTAAMKYFSKEEIETMQSCNIQHPLIYQEYDSVSYAEYILGQMEAGDDSVA